MCLNIGTPNNHHFPLGTNGKVVVLDVPIHKHFRLNLIEKISKWKCLQFAILNIVYKTGALTFQNNPKILDPFL